MVDSLDLFIAVIGIVAAIVGSSAPLWMALSRKADKDDLAHLEARMDAKLDALERRIDAKFDTLDTKVDGVETRLGASITRIEGKLDALILRLVPEQLPPPGELGAGRG
jgi:hypothetical protein